MQMDDWNQIAGIVGALAVHVDARQWDRLLLCFAPTVRLDYTSLFGGEPEVLAAEVMIERWRRFVPQFTRTCHLIGAPFITLCGESAEATASVQAWHYLKEPGFEGRDCWQVGGAYEMGFSRLGGAWRMDKLTLARAWAEGNLELPRIASERSRID
jgi:hypothetical protein